MVDDTLALAVAKRRTANRRRRLARQGQGAPDTGKDERAWDPCRPFLQFIAGLLAVATTLAVAALAALPVIDGGANADPGLAPFYRNFLAALARVIITGTILAALLSLFRTLLPARPFGEWHDGHYLAVVVAGSGSALLTYFGWRVAELAITGLN